MPHTTTLLTTMLLLALCVDTASANPKNDAQPAPTHADVPYDGFERNTLDFWQAKGEGVRPLLVYIHGGGWIQGDKSTIRFVDSWLAKGVSVAAINYRFTPQNPLPIPVHDAARAIQFLRSKAGEWNIDKSRVVLSGVSAGGCSSLWLALHDDLADPKAKDPVKRESTRVQGAAVAGAQTSIDPKQVEPWIGPMVYHKMLYSCVGEDSIDAVLKNYANHEAHYREFSPITHLSKDDPPVFLSYNPDMTIPAKSFKQGIHHGIFGVKLQEKSVKAGHNQVHLSIRNNYESREFENQEAFIESILLDKFTHANPASH